MSAMWDVVSGLAGMWTAGFTLWAVWFKIPKLEQTIEQLQAALSEKGGSR